VTQRVDEVVLLVQPGLCNLDLLGLQEVGPVEETAEAEHRRQADIVRAECEILAVLSSYTILDRIIAWLDFAVRYEEIPVMAWFELHHGHAVKQEGFGTPDRRIG